MKFSFYKIIIAEDNSDNINHPKSNPFYHIEDEADKLFSAKPPDRHSEPEHYTTAHPLFHYQHGAQDPYGVAKYSDESGLMPPHVAHEGLAYQLGKHVAPDIFPRTVIRNLRNPLGASNESVPTSIQEFHKPNNEEFANHMDTFGNHPDYHKMILSDWLHSNGDRHKYNIIHTKDDRLKAIDNGLAFYHGQNTEAYPGYKDEQGLLRDADAGYNSINGNIHDVAQKFGHLPIPSDFRKNVLNFHPDHAASIIDTMNNHPKYGGASILDLAKPHYLDRLQTLQHHFRNPNVRTMRDLYKELYPSLNLWGPVD